MSLYASILNSTESTPAEATNSETQEKKWFFTKTKEWVWEQWDDVWSKEKWKTEWWKNLLRTAWFVATWVGAVALTVKWVKKLWNWAFWDNEEETSEEAESDSKKVKKNKEKDSESFWDWSIWKFIKWAWAVLW
jgi:hypothetical protein